MEQQWENLLVFLEQKKAEELKKMEQYETGSRIQMFFSGEVIAFEKCLDEIRKHVSNMHCLEK